MEQTGEVLEFNGEQYVTSARAGKLVGYTKDYVGQLARAGKVKARLIGRSWYVLEDSIRAHKLEMHHVLTNPKKNIESEVVSKNDISNKNIVFSHKNIPDSLSALKKVSTPQQQVPLGHAHALRELAHADVRFEDGQALVFDDAHIPLIAKEKQTQLLPATEDVVLTSSSVEKVSKKNTPFLNEDEFSVPLHVIPDQEEKIFISPQKFVRTPSRNVSNTFIETNAVVPFKNHQRTVPLRTMCDVVPHSKRSLEVNQSMPIKKIYAPVHEKTEFVFDKKVPGKRIPVLLGFLSIIFFSVLHFIFLH